MVFNRCRKKFGVNVGIILIFEQSEPDKAVCIDKNENTENMLLRNDSVDKEYRAFWNGKMWEVMAIDYRIPETVILTDGTIDYINVPLMEVRLMKSTWKKDISGKVVYEGDFIESHQGTQVLDILMMVKYGTYQAYCPADDAYMDNVGFYVEAVNYPQMPLGPMGEYAKVIGNVCENTDLLDKEVISNEST